MSCHTGDPCLPSTNPRREHMCVWCAKPIVSSPGTRDAALARELLDIAGDWAGATGPYNRLVLHGLEVGDDLYGNRFLDRDGLTDAQEEVRDAGCYLILELERLRPLVGDEEWGELRMVTIAGLVAAHRLHAEVSRLAGLRQSFQV